MWHDMRGAVIERFPEAPRVPKSIEEYQEFVEGVYLTDAFNSLSIEGYRVTTALIDKVRTGAWNPDTSDFDRHDRDVQAARGYWQAFEAVRESVERVLRHENPGAVVDEDHHKWYRELFGATVSARPADLAGYRNGQVFIRHSMHVPPRCEAVRDLMPALFDLLRNETVAGVRAVLGHLLFVYIHPYPDGNGRMGRFLMNVMLAAGGYPWVVIPVGQRDTYMTVLEDASVRQSITPFADFVGRLVEGKIKEASVE
jgi:Fic family protein